ncbi:MAG TPA: nucleotidyltransferase [Pyrinomonadaceae bacterium]|nr:nucleotidyltransferase [Pyrinomonadaceae bacterium]
MLDQLQNVFASFQKNEVKYLVIGGIAAVLYGVPRATFDLDILIEPSLENAQALIVALDDANLGTASMTTAEQIIATEITIFKDRIRLDVQTSIPGLVFASAWQRRVTMKYKGQPFYVVSREDLIASKRASARAVDLEDVRILELSGSDPKEE